MKVLAIDQGTTATKSFTLDESGRFESGAAFEHQQIYPNAGELPPIPAPRAKITPDAPLSQDLLQRFSEAVARNWKSTDHDHRQ